jgi:hypothetical protein
LGWVGSAMVRTIVVSRSENQGATPTFKRTFDFIRCWAFVDHGP